LNPNSVSFHEIVIKQRSSSVSLTTVTKLQSISIKQNLFTSADKNDAIK